MWANLLCFQSWCGLVTKSCPTVATSQAPLSMELSGQEYWSGLPFPLQWIFLTQGSNLGLLRCRQIPYQLRYEGSPDICTNSTWFWWLWCLQMLAWLPFKACISNIVLPINEINITGSNRNWQSNPCDQPYYKHKQINTADYHSLTLPAILPKAISHN